MEKPKLIIVEDEPINALFLKRSLHLKGFDIVGIASSGEDAIEITEKTKPDLILMDIMLSGKIDGIEAAEKIKKKNNVSIIYFSAHSDDNTIKRANATNPSGFIMKPIGLKDLYSAVDLALKN